MITDQTILETFLTKKNTVKSVRCSSEWLSKHPDIADYLSTRFSDSQSIAETIYRIFHHLESRPVCQTCGKSVNFKFFTVGFSRFCSPKCVQNSKETRDKVRQTLLSNYGVDNPAKSQEVYKKIKETNVSRYGASAPIQNEEIQKKIKETNLQKYGCENAASNDVVKEKIISTNQQRYHSNCPLQNPDIWQKAVQTSLSRYSAESFSQTTDFKLSQSQLMSSKEMQDRINETKRKHKSFNSSSIENQFEKFLIAENISYVRSYRSAEYPFNCDFYFPDYDLYLEIQGSWTHGKHPYDPDLDKDLLQKWKAKQSRYYDNAIKTWTIRDPLKRQIARQNSLNYLEVFSIDIQQVISQFFLKISSQIAQK